MITYCRVEAKLIHGQTTTVLRGWYPCDGIIVLDDVISTDTSMKRILAAATPHGIQPYFFSLEDGIPQLEKAQASEKNYFVIFRSPVEVANIIKLGYKFPIRITCGQQFMRENALNVMTGLGLTNDEIEALEYIASAGEEVVFDPGCTNENLSWTEVEKLIIAAREKKNRQSHK